MNTKEKKKCQRWKKTCDKTNENNYLEILFYLLFFAFRNQFDTNQRLCCVGDFQDMTTSDITKNEQKWQEGSGSIFNCM